MSAHRDDPRTFARWRWTTACGHPFPLVQRPGRLLAEATSPRLVSILASLAAIAAAAPDGAPCPNRAAVNPSGPLLYHGKSRSAYLSAIPAGVAVSVGWLRHAGNGGHAVAPEGNAVTRPCLTR